MNTFGAELLANQKVARVPVGTGGRPGEGMGAGPHGGLGRDPDRCRGMQEPGRQPGRPDPRGHVPGVHLWSCPGRRSRRENARDGSRLGWHVAAAGGQGPRGAGRRGVCPAAQRHERLRAVPVNSVNCTFVHLTSVRKETRGEDASPGPAAPTAPAARARSFSPAPGGTRSASAEVSRPGGPPCIVLRGLGPRRPPASSRWLPRRPAVSGRPARSVQVSVSLIKIKMSEGQRCTKSHFY